MAESQKKDPPAKSKEKSSLADIDFDKDLFGSWKSMSMGDDGMDFDFGPPTKGKQKAFRFDQMDMDFSLDADFGKISSFNLDMPGFDVSSPAKKSGKSKEGSKEEASGGTNQSKRDSFGFSFDFDGFGGLDFESKKTKTDENSNKSKEKEGRSNASISGDSGELLAKDVDAFKDDDTSFKNPASRGVINSKVDIQTDSIKDPDTRTEDINLKSVIDESSLLKPAHSEDQEIQRMVEPIQESPSSEKRYSPEPHAQKVVQDPYVHFEDTNFGTEDTFSDVQEEESRNLVKILVSPSTGDDQNDVRPVAELVPTGNFSEHLEAHSEKGEMCERRDANVITDHIGDGDVHKADSHLEIHLTPGIENSAHEELADKRNLLGSGTAINESTSDKERGKVPIRSKYFKKQNGSESELQQASASSTKLFSIGNKRTNTLPSNPALEKREFGSRSLESGSKFTGLSRSLPKVVREDIPVQTENTEASHGKSLKKTREGLNTDDIRPRSESMVTTVAHDISLMKEPVSKGSDQNNALRSDVQPSSSTEQPRKNIPLNIINPGTSTHNMRKPGVKEHKISLTKAEIKASEVSTLRVSRPMELKLKPLSSLLPKGLTCMKNKNQSPELQTNTVFKRNLSVDTMKRTPPTPTLKRKASEESTPRLTPLKRLSASPCSSKITALSKKAVEEQGGGNHSSLMYDKSPRLNVSLTEMDIASTENDDIFEKAEAFSKELEDICNMLKKKHEEANDILVRAIVNNNELLMLNHPIHQDKIRMVQEFAVLLIDK
ncbi:uncharacterized protein At4g18490-like [Bidens hawaiensis]|uniref:uncharacterized protein At4g18490-like n=1 Tax=Bidens hawaiensis TaxID=980011 RepID=UPI00404A2DEF